jgi:hypothetical protein
MSRNAIAKDLRTPKYAPRVVKDKKASARRRACRGKVRHD